MLKGTKSKKGANATQKKKQLGKPKKEVEQEVPEHMSSDEEEIVQQSEDESMQQSEDETPTPENSLEPVGVGYTVLVLGLPLKAKREELAKIFAPCGKVLSILFVTSYSKIYVGQHVNTKGMKAFVVLDSKEAVKRAITLKESINGCKLSVIIPYDSSLSNETNTVFINNLNCETNEEGIKNFFSSCGEISSVSFVNITPENKKAFVCFKTQEAADSALEKTRSTLDERIIYVVKYSAKKSKSKKFNPSFKGKMTPPGKKVHMKTKFEKGNKKPAFRGVKKVDGGIKKSPKFKPAKITSEK